jgi:glycosyltransferase involved in cell wall biosynthesis
MDIAIIPSAGEGFPLIAQEAMASGLATVLVWDAGYEGTVTKEVIASCDGVDALSATVLRLVKDPDWRSRVAESGRQWAVTNWSWERALAHYERLYQRMASMPRTRLGAARD